MKNTILILIITLITISCKPTIIAVNNDCTPNPEYSYVSLMELKDIYPMGDLEYELLAQKIDKLYCLVQNQTISFEHFKEIIFEIDIHLTEGITTIQDLNTMSYICYEGSTYADCQICNNYYNK